MLLDRLYAQGSVISTTLQGLKVRNQVISNNIANAEVPGFRARRVDFEDSLIDALSGFPRCRNFDLSGVTPRVSFQNPDAFYRLDGSSVDIEVEMVHLYQNSMRFDTLVTSVMANSRRLSTVLQRSG